MLWLGAFEGLSFEGGGGRTSLASGSQSVVIPQSVMIEQCAFFGGRGVELLRVWRPILVIEAC